MNPKFSFTSSKSFNEINSSPLNNSKTKQAFTFSRTSRFIPLKPVVNKTTYIQDVIEKHSKRKGAGIGYGKRWSFQKCVTETPTSWKYHLTPFIDQNVQEKRGSSFSLGRQEVQFGSYMSKQIMKNPSVDKYEGKQQIIKNKAPQFTMRKRLSLSEKHIGIESQNSNPGPGAYDNPQILTYPSKLMVSKFSNIIYGVNRTPRFDKNQTLSPGPTKYKSDGSQGKIINSKHKNTPYGKFSITRKESEFEKGAKISFFKPGPGSYQMPSDFGIYHESAVRSTRKQVSILED